MAAGPQEIGPTIAGVVVPICHSGDPADGHDTPQSHDCCDACALCAPVVVPTAPQVVAPLSFFSFLAHRPPAIRSAVLSRQRTPRLAQAPPA